MNSITIMLFLFLPFTSQFGFAQTSEITGKVEDAASGEALIGANILVNELPGLGAATDVNGNFRMAVPLGSYSLRVSLIGYSTVVKTDVIVRSGKETFVLIKLSPTNIELEEVTVKGDYFDKTIQVNNLATVVLSSEEIRRSPGSAQDFQRILQGMAGVSFSTDQTNELLVRGGSPNENLTLFDNMELHSTNHYPNEFNSGGPINMVNVDLIESIQFSTGGFISKYGDKLSSVMVIDTREGTRSSLFKSNLNLSMAGFGTVLEGRINEGKGSWVLSARKSYIDLIASSFGVSAIPKYYDLQFKAAYDLSPEHKLSWSGIFGSDKILFEGAPDVTITEFANAQDTIGYNRVDVKQQQYASGLTLRSIWSKSFFSLVTFFFNNYHNDVDVTEEFTERVFNDKGTAVENNVLKRRPLFQDKHDNYQMALKGEMVWKIDPANELSFGVALGTGHYIQNLYLFGDSARYFINGNWSPTITVPASQIEYDIRLFENYKSYLYLNDKMKLLDDRLVMNLGVRYDHFTYSGQGNVSPRMSLSYYLVPAITNINLAYGEYYQTLSYPTYGDREKTDVNKRLENTRARHFVAGFEHILNEGLRLTLEGYYKQYSKIPVSEEFIHYSDRTFRSLKNLTVQSQKNCGVDLLLQQKFVNNIYGTLSYSRMWTEMDDPRIGREGMTYISGYDFPHVLTLILGKRFIDLRTKLNEMPFFIKYPSYILPFSDDMEISMRWRYASGRPYTPRIWTTAEQHFEGETRWSKGTWVTSDEMNSTRFPDYHRLDIAFNSRYNFSTWDLNIFLSVSNIYNRKNIAMYQYNSDGTVDNVYQFSLFPVAGIEVNF